MKYAILFALKSGSILGFEDGTVQFVNAKQIHALGMPSDEIEVMQVGEEPLGIPVEGPLFQEVRTRMLGWQDYSVRGTNAEHFFTAIFAPKNLVWILKGDSWSLPDFGTS